MTAAQLGQLPKLYVYVDETGDRGYSPQSSPFFAMTALMVPAEDDPDVRFTAGGLRALVNTDKPLHWTEHFKAKRPERRRHAAQKLTLMPSVKVVHVIAEKDSVRAFGGMVQSRIFYNFATKLLLERVAYAARGWSGGPRLAIVQLDAVKGMDHTDTASYLDRVRRGLCDNYEVPWNHIKWPPKWTQDRDGLQLADIHAGLLNAALSGDPNDDDCAENLLLCKDQMYRSDRGALLGYGVKVIGGSTIVTGRSWWKKWSIS